MTEQTYTTSKDVIETLCKVLKAFVEILESDGKTYCRDSIGHPLTDLESHELQGAQHLLCAYGGIDSFNGFIIEQRMFDTCLSWSAVATNANGTLTPSAARPTHSPTCC